MTPADPARRVVGLVLAAGEGSRLGRPKALVEGPDGVLWVSRAVGALSAAGADPVYVVVGADAGAVRAAAPVSSRFVEATQWREGMGASLRAGLVAVALAEPDAVAVLVLLVDTPGVGVDVVVRLAGLAANGALARATYDGRPGHPVLLGRDHWAGVQASAGGDRGARDYLSAHEVVDVECSDIADGTDIDTQDALDAWRARRDRDGAV
jgi:CTP:molybdopterin cytidylyltransferase MocA